MSEPAPETAAPHKKIKPPKKTKILIISLVILTAVLAGATAFFALNYTKLKSNPEAASQEEASQLKDKVGKLITLPDEAPTIATVKDASKLKDQEFFKNAKNGDKVLIFTNAKQAVIYREGENKLVNVGPITLESADSATDKPAETKEQD